MSISHIAWAGSAWIDKSRPKTARFVNPAGAFHAKWEIPETINKGGVITTDQKQILTYFLVFKQSFQVRSYQTTVW
jgi:hypothetical protein